MTTAIITSLKETVETYLDPWPVIKFLAYQYTLPHTHVLGEWRQTLVDKPDWLAFFENLIASEALKIWSEDAFIDAIDRSRTLYIYRIAQFFEKKNTLVRVSEAEIIAINKFFSNLALKATVPPFIMEIKPWIQK